MKRIAKILFIVFIAILLSSYSNTKSIRQLLNAIKQVETGSGSGIGIKGDKGRAYGPYQIHEEYFIDSKVSGEWELCLTNKEFSERVIIAYWNRYQKNALKSLDFEILARCHNGGPKGHLKTSTLIYWDKVKKLIK